MTQLMRQHLSLTPMLTHVYYFSFRQVNYNNYFTFSRTTVYKTST